MKKYHIWTIGCQMNVADSTHVGAELEKLGYEPTADIDEAEVVVLNTCVVRQSAEDKAAGKLGSLKPWRKQNPDRTLALMGCMVGVKPAPALVESLPWVDVFMAPSQAQPLVDHLRNHMIEEELAALERQQLASPLPVSGRRLPHRFDQAPGLAGRSACDRARADRLRLLARLHLLHHPLPPRRRAQPPAGRDRARGARPGRAGREGGDAAGPDRRSLRQRLRRTARTWPTCCTPCTRSTGWSASAS